MRFDPIRREGSCAPFADKGATGQMLAFADQRLGGAGSGAENGLDQFLGRFSGRRRVLAGGKRGLF